MAADVTRRRNCCCMGGTRSPSPLDGYTQRAPAEKRLEVKHCLIFLAVATIVAGAVYAIGHYAGHRWLSPETLGKRFLESKVAWITTGVSILLICGVIYAVHRRNRVLTAEDIQE